MSIIEITYLCSQYSFDNHAHSILFNYIFGNHHNLYHPTVCLNWYLLTSHVTQDLKFNSTIPLYFRLIDWFGFNGCIFLTTSWSSKCHRDFIFEFSSSTMHYFHVLSFSMFSTWRYCGNSIGTNMELALSQNTTLSSNTYVNFPLHFRNNSALFHHSCWNVDWLIESGLTAAYFWQPLGRPNAAKLKRRNNAEK